MIQESIYGNYHDILEDIKDNMISRINEYTKEEFDKTGIKIHEHLIARVKEEESMRENAGVKMFLKHLCPH